MNSLMGTQSFTLTLKTDGNSLSGSSVSSQGTQEFDGGTVENNEFAFSIDFNGPTGQMQLDFQGAVNGDEVSGQVELGSYGSATFKGSRT